MKYPLSFEVNGVLYDVEVEAARSLLSVLRTELGLTGTKEGCDDSECGACMVLIDGQPLNSCSYLALQARGRIVDTVEGLAHDGQLHPLQRAFLEEGGVQCGFCTPGMLITARDLILRGQAGSERQIRDGLSGNICRCTGYTNIVIAIAAAAKETSDAR
jgi:aerobic-type carbon monoxide dehydrogenase small subunit (CoxS/CutS family)